MNSENLVKSEKKIWSIEYLSKKGAIYMPGVDGKDALPRWATNEMENKCGSQRQNVPIDMNWTKQEIQDFVWLQSIWANYRGSFPLPVSNESSALNLESTRSSSTICWLVFVGKNSQSLKWLLSSRRMVLIFTFQKRNARRILPQSFSLQSAMRWGRNSQDMEMQLVSTSPFRWLRTDTFNLKIDGK